MKTSLQTESEKKIIKQRFGILLNACNCSAEGKERIRKVFEFANSAHMGVRRKSGEPYILHPIAVATIVVTEIGLHDDDAICAALLHDVVEDTEYVAADIESRFGVKVKDLVEGLTKIQGAFEKTASRQAENFKKILLTLVNDVDVILIKLADRLHNMRTLDAMTEKKQFQIASETFYLFAPLAERLGFYAIKSELEDLSLKYYEPEAYAAIKEQIDRKEAESATFIDDFEQPIIKKLNEANIEFTVSSRFKSVYSTWRKMQNKNVPFEEIYDLFAIRIVFKPIAGLPERTQCWSIYSLISEIYHSKLERLRDWVGTPKANGYEALHCTLMGKEGTWVEVQIRTERMDEIAERGIAAHWKYKNRSNAAEQDTWLQHVRENMMQYDNENAEIFVDTFKTDLLPEIFVFTPQGEQKMMPKGSTALDFAYEIHTEIGNHAAAAKINRRLMPLNYVLASADQVEIITIRNQHPKKEWLEFVITTKAKNLIRAALKSDVKEHSRKGKEIIDAKLSELGIQPSARTYRKLIAAYGQNHKEELFSNVGAGLLSLDNFNKVIRENTPQKWINFWGVQFGFGNKNKIKTLRKKVEEKKQNERPVKIDPKQTYLIKDDSKLIYSIAECCKPIPGDEIIGIVNDNLESVVIHKKKCSAASHEAAQHANRIVNVQWSVHKILSFLATVELHGIDRIGILREMTEIVTNQLNVNIRKLNLESHDGIFEGVIELYVHDLEDLNNLIAKLQQIKSMYSVKRIEKIN